MGIMKKMHTALKKRYALKHGYYVSGSRAGFGVQNERRRLGLISSSHVHYVAALRNKEAGK